MIWILFLRDKKYVSGFRHVNKFVFLYVSDHLQQFEGLLFLKEKSNYFCVMGVHQRWKILPHDFRLLWLYRIWFDICKSNNAIFLVEMRLIYNDVTAN